LYLNTLGILQSEKNNHFELLKQKIVVTMQQSYPGINPVISEWKGQEITDFQEELLKQANAHISEKWFYNHIKKNNDTLPRIDVLNLLSKYAGYANWDDFVYKNGGKALLEKPKTKANKYFVLVPALVVVIMAVLFTVFKVINTHTYNFSFYDASTKEPIKGQIEVKLMIENESPVTLFTDSSGILKLKSQVKKLTMLVSAPYYLTDTIIRTLKSFEKGNMISLKPNDYAMMIRYFSEMNIHDWQKRREKLYSMIDEAAIIYQVINERKNIGMELYNKEEFIDKLTMPSGNLRYIEVLDTKYRNEKIIMLKFMINKK
jgi:uncharacterized integral membrane protein